MNFLFKFMNFYKVANNFKIHGKILWTFFNSWTFPEFTKFSKFLNYFRIRKLFLNSWTVPELLLNWWTFSDLAGFSDWIFFLNSCIFYLSQTFLNSGTFFKFTNLFRHLDFFSKVMDFLKFTNILRINVFFYLFNYFKIKEGKSRFSPLPSRQEEPSWSVQADGEINEIDLRPRPTWAGRPFRRYKRRSGARLDHCSRKNWFGSCIWCECDWNLEGTARQHAMLMIQIE